MYICHLSTLRCVYLQPLADQHKPAEPLAVAMAAVAPASRLADKPEPQRRPEQQQEPKSQYYQRHQGPAVLTRPQIVSISCNVEEIYHLNVAFVTALREDLLRGCDGTNLAVGKTFISFSYFFRMCVLDCSQRV